MDQQNQSQGSERLEDVLGRMIRMNLSSTGPSDLNQTTTLSTSTTKSKAKGMYSKSSTTPNSGSSASSREHRSSQVPHYAPSDPPTFRQNQPAQSNAMPNNFGNHQIAYNQPNYRQPGPNTNRGFSHQNRSHQAPRNYHRANYQGASYQGHNHSNSMQYAPSGYGRPLNYHSNHLHDPSVTSQRPKANPAYWQILQATYIQNLVDQEVPIIEISEAERMQKEAFLSRLRSICSTVSIANPTLSAVSLECFGSFKSGFASAGSDMDLAIVSQENSSNSTCISLDEDGLPRTLEKYLLMQGIGARLLDKTRVPIIQVCEKPDETTLAKLRQNRQDWDALPVEKKYPHRFQEKELQLDPDNTGDLNNAKSGETVQHSNGEAAANALKRKEPTEATADNNSEATKPQKDSQPRPRNDRIWTRERKKGPLDFPKDGVGVHCDINFFNPLGLHNTQLLRCYSICDPRVRPMILFVKEWAKRRKINSSYSGTLSSYGYVLMVLHYLVNIATPPVLPNLQCDSGPNLGSFQPGKNPIQVEGWNVDFCRDEAALAQAARDGLLTSNTESLGFLLAEFFHYYATQGGWRPDNRFHWFNNVLSLRTPGGILTKDEKGWRQLKKEEVDGKEVRHRYLFAVEDPFELKHNVARTVTHDGIKTIRDEFRRAHSILMDAGNRIPGRNGELLDLFVPPPSEEEFTKEEGLPRSFNVNDSEVFPGLTVSKPGK